MNDELYDLQVTNKETFLQFMNLLLVDFQTNSKEWENDTLPRFLEAVKAYTQDGIKNSRQMDWNTLAEILKASIVHE
jgi:hypothetical protein